jgi:hypothetical protein
MSMINNYLNRQMNNAKWQNSARNGDVKDANFRGALSQNQDALNTVETVESMSNILKAADGKAGIDQNDAQGAVSVDGQATKQGLLQRFQQDSTLQNLAKQAPDAGPDASVKGSMDENGMNLEVSTQDGPLTFSQTNKEDGSVVYQAGDNVVTQGPNGSLHMGVRDF